MFFIALVFSCKNVYAVEANICDYSKEFLNWVKLSEEETNELISLIEKYNSTHEESIKEQIINNEFFKEYKISENEINYIILEINSKLKQISKKGSCSK